MKEVYTLDQVKRMHAVLRAVDHYFPGLPIVGLSQILEELND